MSYRKERNSQYTAIFRIVNGTPILANSRKVMLSPDFFSAFWITMTLLAAPNMSRFPAIVLPAASAISSVAVAPAWERSGR